ncbi:hypothetical protein L210DRAFT_848936, partial [Boletus edulis BED1]
MAYPSYFLSLPLRTADNAPRFDASDVTSLPRFFERINSFSSFIKLTDTQKIQVSMRYAYRDDTTLWGMLPEATTSNPDWLVFVSNVLLYYPGCEDERPY